MFWNKEANPMDLCLIIFYALKMEMDGLSFSIVDLVNWMYMAWTPVNASSIMGLK